MEKIKLLRVDEVADIMGAALFLASDASAMVTGSAMMIDGGWTAGCRLTPGRHPLMCGAPP